MIFRRFVTYREWSDWVGENCPSSRYEVEVTDRIEIVDLVFGQEDDWVLHKVRWPYYEYS